MFGPEMNLSDRVLGAAAGAFLALVFLLPKTWGDLIRRGIFSVVFGIIFAVPMRNWLGWDTDMDNTLAAACAAAFVSWLVAAGVVKALEKIRFDAPKD